MSRRCLLLVGLAVAALAPRATAAAEATASGWWTISPVAVAPDGEGSLVVQGGAQADQPQSFAAVQFALGTGESAARLRLSVAPGSASTSGATLTVCPLTPPFTPVDGGPMADAPPYDCAAKVTVAPDSMGGYTADVTSLDESGVLALAILPGAVTDRVVLTKPTGTSLETVRSETGGESAAGGGDDGAGDDAVQDPSFITGMPDAPSTWRFEADSFGPPSTDLPAGTGQPTSSIAAPTPSSVPSSSAAIRPVAATRDDQRGIPFPAIAIVCLALLAAGLWLTAGRMAELPGSSFADHR